MQAARHGLVNKMRCLIEAGANAGVSDLEGNTPLHLAAAYKKDRVALGMVEMLLDVCLDWWTACCSPIRRSTQRFA